MGRSLRKHSNPSLRSAKSGSSTSHESLEQLSWIEQNILKMECDAFVTKPTGNCFCGRSKDKHSLQAMKNGDELLKREERLWHIDKNTISSQTDAFGTLEFQGGPHPTKARYVRCHYRTRPASIIHLLMNEWHLPQPNVVISVIGGLANFELHPKLQKVFNAGLVKAAKTTGAWIITTGVDSGVAKHVGEALKDEIHVKGSKIVAIGIAPWGMVQHRANMIGKDKTCQYYSISNAKNNQAVLNQYHNYFLLADSGTINRFGAELSLRRSLEQHLAAQHTRTKLHSRLKNSATPVVAILVEGGIQAFRLVFQLLTSKDPVPVVVCEGSGRAANFLAYMYHNSDEDGDLHSIAREQLLKEIEKRFFVSRKLAVDTYKEIQLCLKSRDLITVFRVEDDCPDIDVAILSVLLQKSRPKLIKADQLAYTLLWNRPDIARSRIFGDHTDLNMPDLNPYMTEALLQNQVEFVKLLLENGVNVQKFLSQETIEILYNRRYLVGDFSFHSMLTKVLDIKRKQPITLKHVGQLIQILMGKGYRHQYVYRRAMEKLRVRDHDTCSSIDNIKNASGALSDQNNNSNESWSFRYPYTELLQWALLTRRYEMAMYMVICGEESIAKSLMALKLLKGVKSQLNLDIESEYLEEIKIWELQFENVAVQLQDHCYKHDPEQTRRLLCYELLQFSGHTCISLAYISESKAFLSHVCTQNILNDLWYGGLKVGKWVGPKVFAILLCMSTIVLTIPACIALLKWKKVMEFKTKQELALQPQTLEEFLNDSSSESSSDTSSSEDSSDEDNPVKSKNDHTVGMRKLPNWVDHEMTPGIQIDDFGDDYNISRIGEMSQSYPTLNKDFLNVTESREHTVIDMGDNADSKVPSTEFINGKFRRETFPGNTPPSSYFSSTRKKKVDMESLRKRKNAGMTLDLNSHLEKENDLSTGPDPNLRTCSTALSLSTYQAQMGRFQYHSNGNLAHRSSVTFNPTGFAKYIQDRDGFDFHQNPQGTQLSWKKKLHEFFYAPITKFYLSVIAYTIFIILLIRLCVVKLEKNEIDYLELYVYLYTITNFIGHFRKVAIESDGKLKDKILMHLNSFWNFFDFLLCVISIIGISLRYYSLCEYWFHVNQNNTQIYSDNQTLFLWGRNLIIITSSGWVMEFLELMQNWRLFGAYMEMIRGMANQITPPILILFIIMTSFGVVRQGIMFHGLDDLSFGNILKNIYLKPYFMLYGEVYAAEIDPVDFPTESKGTPLTWVVPLLMVIFMICAVVVILSLIIAGITDIYGKLKESSEKVYMYLRYPMIIDYESRHFAPSPFIIFFWICQGFKKVLCKLKSFCCRRCREPDNLEMANAKENQCHSEGLKLFLHTSEIEETHDFEEECVADYLREMKTSEALVVDSVMRRIMQSVDHIQVQVREHNSRFDFMNECFGKTNSKMFHINTNLSSQGTMLAERFGSLETKILSLCDNQFRDNASNQQTNVFGDGLSNSLLSRNPSLRHRLNCNNQGPGENINLMKDSFINSSDFLVDNNVLSEEERRRHDTQQASNESFTRKPRSSHHRPMYFSSSHSSAYFSHLPSHRDTPLASPTTSIADLTLWNGPYKHSKQTKRNKRKTHREKNLVETEDHLHRAEKVEREEMTDLMMQRIRQLSHRNNESSTEEVVNLQDVVEEINDSKSSHAIISSKECTKISSEPQIHEPDCCNNRQLVRHISFPEQGPNSMFQLVFDSE